MIQNDLQNWPINNDRIADHATVSLQIGMTMVILKKEKRTKKERKEKVGGELGLSHGPALPLYFINNNRTSLTVNTPDIFNCA